MISQEEDGSVAVAVCWNEQLEVTACPAKRLETPSSCSFLNYQKRKHLENPTLTPQLIFSDAVAGILGKRPHRHASGAINQRGDEMGSVTGACLQRCCLSDMLSVIM